MLRGLMETDVANGTLPSAYFWDDEMGDTQVIPQGEGGRASRPPHASALLPQFAQSVEILKMYGFTPY